MTQSQIINAIISESNTRNISRAEITGQFHKRKTSIQNQQKSHPIRDNSITKSKHQKSPSKICCGNKSCETIQKTILGTNLLHGLSNKYHSKCIIKIHPNMDKQIFPFHTAKILNFFGASNDFAMLTITGVEKNPENVIYR